MVRIRKNGQKIKTNGEKCQTMMQGGSRQNCWQPHDDGIGFGIRGWLRIVAVPCEGSKRVRVVGATNSASASALINVGEGRGAWGVILEVFFARSEFVNTLK